MHSENAKTFFRGQPKYKKVKIKYIKKDFILEIVALTHGLRSFKVLFIINLLGA